MSTPKMQSLPHYDRQKSYVWNYDNAPEPVDAAVPAVHGEWFFCGLSAASPLGMPAGPLLNGRWILYYASLGFDVLTYKTVRSGHRDCYELPNLVPVETGPLTGGEERLRSTDDMRGSWAVSFGMPSKTPEVWRRDVEWTRSRLAPAKLLSVSVVGTVQPGWSIEDLGRDYAQCAKWAVESGADTVEINFSCPNVSTCDGQLFQQPNDAAIVCAAVRQEIGSTPLIVKIGHVCERDEAATLLDALAPHIAGIAMTNSVAATIETEDGSLLFDGERRGICGRATFEASLVQTELFAELIRDRGEGISIIGVGGASTVDHVRAYLQAGAESVQIGTAAMIDPNVAVRIREAFSK